MSREIPAFVHIEKTGGTTLIYMLRRNFPVGHCDIIPRDKRANVVSHRDLAMAERVHLPLQSLAGHSIRPFLDLGSFRKRLAFYTVLRNGTERYISDYHHDCIKRGFTDGFAEWLRYEERWNWQTRSLCGTDDLEKAKAVIENDLALVGVMDQYEEFVEGVQSLFYPQPLDLRFTPLNHAGLPKGLVAGQRMRLDNIPGHLQRRAAEVNELDNKLYQYVIQHVLPSQRARLAKSTASAEYRERLRSIGIPSQSLRLCLYSAYRNCVYKPMCGVFPGQVHMLPVNACNVKVRRDQLGCPSVSAGMTTQFEIAEAENVP